MDYYEWNDANPKNSGSSGKIFIILKNISIVAILLSIVLILSMLGWKNDGLRILYNIIIILLIELPLFGAYFVFRFLSKKYYDYDYFILGDMLKIVKIVNKVTRKNALELNLCDIENIGLYDSPSYEQAESVVRQKQSLSCNMEIMHIYVVAMYNGTRQLFILDYDYGFVTMLRKALKRELVFDKDLLAALRAEGVKTK